jgi:hypothetical protein
VDAPAPSISASFEGDPKAAAKSLLQELIFLSEKYPELEVYLNNSIQSLTAETKRTTRSVRDRILLLLEPVTGLTLEELRDDLLVPLEELKMHLSEMAAGPVPLVEIVTTGRRIRPAKGRHEIFIKLAHTSPTGDAYVAPERGRSSTQILADSFD